MGAWGARIYEDDVALDIRHDFIVQLAEGTVVDDIERMVEEENIEADDVGDNDVVWLALCCVELETGTLTDKVKHAALEVIQSGRQHERWLTEAGKDDAAARKRELTLVRKYIESYNGKAVKRKSWIALQKAEASSGNGEVVGEKLDDASWHSEDAWEYKEEDDDAVMMRAGAHIACFVYWLITREYFNARDTTLQKAVDAVKGGEHTADRFLLEELDGKLFSDDVAKSVRDFAMAYFSDGFPIDYEKLILAGKPAYSFVPSRDQQERLALAIDGRLKVYRKSPYKSREQSSSSLVEFVRLLPLRFWGFALLSIVAFCLSAACFWYLLFGS